MTEMSNNKKLIGILGGGQLAKMLTIAASRLGYKTSIFDPNPDSPAFAVSSSHTIGSFKDKEKLVEFVKKLGVLTFEFENIPVSSLSVLSDIVPIFPPIKALAISQDRLHEKEFLRSLGLKTTKYFTISSKSDFQEAKTKIATSAVLKTRKDGYDGKGQFFVEKNTSEAEVLGTLNLGPCILEEFCNFQKEISIIVARSQSGEVVCFDPSENIHKNGILLKTTVPARIPNDISINAALIAGKIVNSLNYIGVMGVEFFLDASNQLLVNEIAPRVHNSGHWTQNGCLIDQFEQHIRSILGWKLGDGKRYANVEMVNLIGDEVEKALHVTDASVYLYGKKDVRAGRKMGHINYVSQEK